MYDKLIRRWLTFNTLMRIQGPITLREFRWDQAYSLNKYLGTPIFLDFKQLHYDQLREHYGEYVIGNPYKNQNFIVNETLSLIGLTTSQCSTTPITYIR